MGSTGRVGEGRTGLAESHINPSSHLVSHLHGSSPLQAQEHPSLPHPFRSRWQTLVPPFLLLPFTWPLLLL